MVSLQFNRTSNSITQLRINYIACDSTFFLDIKVTPLDLSLTDAFAISASQRTISVDLPYKTKSNSSNAQIIYNTVGLQMIRTSNTYSLQITMNTRSSNFFSLNLAVGGNNRLKAIRMCSMSYETIATTIDPPFYLNMGVVSGFVGTIPDSSGVTVSAYDTVYTGMVDWTVNDANSVLDFIMTINGISYSLTTNSLTQTKTAYFWYRKISCPNYSFLNASNQCQSCHYSCLTCNSNAQTGCLSCPPTRSFLASNRTCPCISNYIDNGNNLCAQLSCQKTCLTCANINVCGSCNTGAGRVLKGIDCVCKDYTIDVYGTTNYELDAFCYPCHPTCLTCSAMFVESACLSCNLVKDKRFYRASNNTCGCIDKYYHLTSTVVCGQCHYSCATCVTGTACTSCNAAKGRVTVGGSTLCGCVSTMYDDTINEQCVACPYRCLTCDSQGCLTCDATMFRQISSKACVCKAGYFDDNANALCNKCDFTCATCTSLTQCASCNSALQRIPETSTGKYLCVCNQRYYPVANQQQCLACDLTCLSCGGPNINNCLSCDATKYRELSVDSKCVCKAGYFQVVPIQELCESCHYTCATCDNAGSCLTCSAVNFRTKNTGTGLCDCMAGYFDNGNQLCVKCDYKCLTCSSLATCLTCDSATRITSNLANCICKDGFYDDGVSSSCQPCMAQCQTCSNANSCLSCPAIKTLTATKNCICKSHTYPPSCLDCHYSCQQCINTANQCTKCNGLSMRYLSVSKTCLCYDGYFDDGTNEMCAGCHYSCTTCSSYASCLTCPANRVKIGALCNCVDKLYENSVNKKCLACHYSCKTCQTFSQCTTCDATQFRRFPLTGLTNLTLCQCFNGYYDNQITELCFKCDAKCLTCSAYSTCLSCDPALKRYFVPGTNDCKCLDGFYEDGVTFLCMPCDYSCQTCTDGVSCATCVVGRHLPAVGTGFCQCDVGTFDNPAAETCNTCLYPCVQCSGTSSYCTKCDSTRNLVVDGVALTSQCQCKVETFENGTACDTCLSECSQCTNKLSCTVCKIGANRNLDANNLCPCIYGYHDQDSTLITCQKCHRSCLTCTNAQTCTTCFTGRISVTGSTCACPAQRFYDDGTSSACAPCSYDCLTCFSLANFCTSCSPTSNRQLVNNKCTCKVGFFETPNVQTCVKCHYSCKSCVNGAACLTCDSGLMRIYTTGPYCICDKGYFDDGTAQCKPCDYTCTQCQGTATTCKACPLTRTYDSVNNKCPCSIGLFDIGVPTCSNCLYSCKECANGLQCTTCPTTRTLEPASKQCLCNSGLYNVPNQAQCPTCHALCLTCSDYSVCLTCDTPTNLRFLVGGSCVCPNGYFDDYAASGNTNAICQKCDYTCEYCSSKTQCTSCMSAVERIYDPVSKLCKCNPGFYDDGTNMPCVKCPFDCVTCSDAVTCLTCAPERTLDASNRCVCSQSYYQNGTSCQLCQPECSTCTNLTYCTACNGQRILSAANTCVCAIGKFMVPGTALCSPCNLSCESCISSLMCSTCNPAKFRYLSGAFCKCMSGYYDDGTNELCVKCQYSCKTCTVGTACLSCDLPANRVLNINTNLCECLSGYYQDPSTKACIKCHYSCVTCLTGATCLTCNGLHFRQLNVGNSKCQCPVQGYFDDGSQSMCRTCDFRCLTCQTAATTCTSCLASTNRVLEVNKCNCISGYFDDGTQNCAKCSYKCLTCDKASDNCTSCLTSSLRTTTPSCSCPDGFYDDGSTSLCKPCDYRCKTCLNPFTCATCDPLMYRSMNPITSICDCQAVFYDALNQPQCIPCTYSCVKCAHPTLCLTCPSTRTYKNGICECNMKYFDDFSSLQCQTCDYSCKTCTNATQCTSCSVLNSRVYNSSTRKCTCAARFYDNGLQQELCLKCHETCAICTNSTHCLSCPSNLNKAINLTVSTYCSCLYGYYEDIASGLALGEVSKCLPCHYSCEKCSGQANACTQCEAGKFRVLNSMKQCLCQVQYFDDGVNELCIKCSTGCVKCWGSAVDQCLQCDSASYILNNRCYATCPDYYYAYLTPSSTKTCKLCTAFCTQCSQQTICLTCQPTHRLFTYNTTHTLCIDHCPQFFYEQPATKKCLECSAPCYHCTNKYQCIDCLSGYYLDTYCYKCHPYCYSCQGPTVFDCVTCVNGYYLDNGLCRKLTCGQYQYVHSLNGCVNCNESYPNGLMCDAQVVKSCREGYMLETTVSGNGTVQTLCKGCGDVAGYKVALTASGQQECVEICGDGIVINDPCDDGNVLNGDGCSEFCKIEPNWSCTNKKNCTLKINPQITVTKVSKLNKKNEIQVYLKLSIGVRLIKQNFQLVFSDPSISFIYSLFPLDAKYSQYRLLITYQATIQQSTLGLKVKSPIKQSTGRLLQSAINLEVPLEIQLNLNLNVDISTQPPAIFVDPETRHVFGTWLVYVFLAYQVICLIMAAWMVYKKLMFMLIVVDLFLAMRMVYVICTFGMYNVTDLVPSALKGLQPFIYSFGPGLSDQSSSFYQFGYTSLLFSSCSIQLFILAICLICKYVATTKDGENLANYYFTAFMYCFATDIYLSCIGIFSETKFQGYVGAYSWATGLILIGVFLSHNFVYVISSKAYLFKTRTILPTNSFATSELDPKDLNDTKGNNILEDESQFANSTFNKKHQQGQEQGQMWSQNHTQVIKSHNSQKNSNNSKKPLQTQSKLQSSFLYLLNPQTLYNLFDLQPQCDYQSKTSSQFYDTQSAFYQTSSKNKLTLYHLPIVNNIMPLAIVLIATLIDLPDKLVLRSALMLGVFVVCFVFMLVDKTQAVKSSIRYIKLIVNFLVYVVICGILTVVSITKSQNVSQWIDITVLILIVLLFMTNIVFWCLNLKYSPQYKDYLIELRNQEILQKTKLSQQPRKKIYTSVDDKSLATSPIKNIFKKYNKNNNETMEIRSSSMSEVNSVQEIFKERKQVLNNQKDLLAMKKVSKDKGKEENVFDVDVEEDEYVEDKIMKKNNIQEVKTPTVEIEKKHYQQKILQARNTQKADKKQSRVEIIAESISNTQTQNQSLNILNISNEKVQFKGLKIRPVDQYQVYLNEPIKNKSSTGKQLLNSQSQQTEILKLKTDSMVSQQLKDNTIKVFENSEMIEKQKRMSPRKVSSLTRLEKKGSDQRMTHMESRDIEDVYDDSLDVQQEPVQPVKHYMYKNKSKQSLSKQKSKPKSKSKEQKLPNRSIPKNKTLNVDEKLLMLQQTNPNHTDLSEDHGDKETNLIQDSRGKDTKMTSYSMERGFVGKNQEKMRRKISQQSDGLSSGLGDNSREEDLDDEDYEPDCPTGIINLQNQRDIPSRQQSQAFKQHEVPSKAKKLKKRQPSHNKSPSKLSSISNQNTLKRTSLSPSKASYYPHPQLSQISSIQQANDLYSQTSELQSELNVYNKILKDHQKYKDKKVDQHLIEKQLLKGNQMRRQKQENEQ